MPDNINVNDLTKSLETFNDMAKSVKSTITDFNKSVTDFNKSVTEFNDVSKKVVARGEKPSAGNLDQYVEPQDTSSGISGKNTVDYDGKGGGKRLPMAKGDGKYSPAAVEAKEKEDEVEETEKMYVANEFLDELLGVIQKSMKDLEYKLEKNIYTHSEKLVDIAEKTLNAVNKMNEKVEKGASQFTQVSNLPSGAPQTKFDKNETINKSDIDHTVFLPKARELFEKGVVPATDLIYLERTKTVKPGSQLHKKLMEVE